VVFFWFAFGRLWAGFLAGGGIITVLSLINYYKIRIRTEAFTASDLNFAGEAAGILSRYKLELTGRVIFIVSALIAGTLAAAFFARGKLRRRWVRLVGALTCLAVFITLFFTVYVSDKTYEAATNRTAEYDQWSELEAFVSKGFIYPFLYSVKSAVRTPPEGYSEAAAKDILAQYSDEAIPAGKKVNIIAVQLEAFKDVTELGVPAYDYVYEPLRKLQSESLTGRFVANSYGGGTQISERCFITGFTNEQGWRKNVNSAVWYLRSQGYATEGFHQNDAWYYNRSNVNRNMGFENYYFMDSLPAPDKSDKVFFEKLTEMWEKRDVSRPYFSFSVSYQNHGAYYDNWTVPETYLERGSLSDASFCILNNYLSGIADTTQRMYDFCHYFDKEAAPVVVVFYGDHSPWMGDGSSVLNEMGINLDYWTEEGFFNYFSTPYIVWANEAAKAVSSGSFSGEGGDLSASYLLDRVFEEIGIKGSAYMQLQRDTRRTIDVINGYGFWLCDGELLFSSEAKSREDAKRFLYGQYYTENHFNYSKVTG
jgi:phosphoglycerol transferase MdoB-like AlkP superfamily enzyme